MTVTIARPQVGEYLPYYETYISRVPPGELLPMLAAQIRETAALLRGPAFAERGGYRYGPDKWTVTQVVGHLSDSERIFAYRALRIARGDATPMAGFEQDDYVRDGGFEARTLADVLAEFEAVRAGSIALFASLTPEAAARRGTANGAAVSVRALGHIIAGHELHHRALLIERYR